MRGRYAGSEDGRDLTFSVKIASARIASIGSAHRTDDRGQPMTSAKRRHHVTLRDIARAAEVSYQTVSLVVNGKPGVSNETRKRVQKLIEELDYRPNRIARMLSTNRSRMLELFLVDVTYGGRLADTVKNMANAAKRHDYSLLISETTADGLAAAVESARSRLIDGVILYAPRLTITDEELRACFGELPVVRRDFVPGSRVPWVGFDQVHATRLALEHLIELGHEDIAAIAPEEGILNGHWRSNAFRTVLREHGLEPGPMAWGDYSMRSGYDAAHALLASDDAFTAVVIGTDNMALGAMHAFREAELRIPDDVSIVSHDNTEFASYLEPPLTTVDFAFGQQDEVAVHYLLELLESPETALHQRVLTPSLVVRKSTSALPKALASADAKAPA